jgi:uncharacterized protein (TIGR02328 family)
MRLWHQNMIPYLSRQHLLGQHRECCALRGKGWGKKHSIVDYVFKYSPMKLFQYHFLVMEEMKKRKYKPDVLWYQPKYRGKYIDQWDILEDIPIDYPIYQEHDIEYYNECLYNLQKKNFDISNFI